MKLEKLNTWLTFAGNIAILLGLVAVAIEINDNTRAMRAQELGALEEMDQNLQIAVLDQQFMRVWAKSLTEPERMNLDEILVATEFIVIFLNNLERAQSAYLAGVITEDDWHERLFTAPVFLGTKFGQTVWKNIQTDYSNRPGFLDSVNQSLKSSPVKPDDVFFLDLQQQLQ